MKITKREIIVCVAIVALWICATVGIDHLMTQYAGDEAIKYEQAVHVKSSDMLSHAINTDLGDVLAYGWVKTINPVGYDDIGKKYMSASWVKERYTMHTRTVVHSYGKAAYTTTEVYYTWDEVDRNHVISKHVEYLGQKIPTKEIQVGEEYIKTVNDGSDVRYKYYGAPKKFKATMFINAKGKANVESIYKDKNIEEVIKDKWGSIKIDHVITWIISMILMCLAVYGFVYLDNDWLNS
jgi:hypothetical protein